MLVPVDGDDAAISLGDGHWHQLIIESTGIDGGRGTPLTQQRERVLVRSAHTASLRHVLGGLAHRVGTVLIGQARIGEAPAKGRVDQGVLATLV